MSGVPSAASGVATTGAVGTAYVWLTYPNLTSFVCFVGTTAVALFGWYILAVERKREQERRCDLMDEVQKIQINGVVVASMVESLLRKEDKK